MVFLILLLIFCCFIAIMFILAVGSTRTRMLVFTPLALIPLLLIFFGSLLPIDDFMLFLFLPIGIISTSIVCTIVGAALLLSPSLKRKQRRYLLAGMITACSPILMIAFNVIIRAVKR